MKAPARFDVVVYGATGFTGQLIAEYLATRYKNNYGDSALNRGPTNHRPSGGLCGLGRSLAGVAD